VEHPKDFGGTSLSLRKQVKPNRWVFNPFTFISLER